MKDVKVTFRPSAGQLNKIKVWLTEEWDVSGEGFCCNWGVIEDAFDNKKMGVISLAKKVIGFITWFDSERVTTIQITEIKLGFRRMGYGRILAEALFDMLYEKGVMILDLHCQPAKSEKAWKKLGFKQYPDVDDFNDYNSKDGKYLYKILVPFDKPTKSDKDKESIELWAVEPYETSRFLPEWKWYPKFEKGSRKLFKPIIFPAKRDWNIQWKKDGSIIKNNKVKRFGKTDINFSDFIIIEQLPLP
ncbi:MAG TPA: GNAT family N-acetyltransferase [Mucilaginibacter sp.]|jgi:hypothetical protein